MNFRAETKKTIFNTINHIKKYYELLVCDATFGLTLEEFKSCFLTERDYNLMNRAVINVLKKDGFVFYPFMNDICDESFFMVHNSVLLELDWLNLESSISCNTDTRTVRQKDNGRTPFQQKDVLDILDLDTITLLVSGAKNIFSGLGMDQFQRLAKDKPNEGVSSVHGNKSVYGNKSNSERKMCECEIHINDKPIPISFDKTFYRNIKVPQLRKTDDKEEKTTLGKKDDKEEKTALGKKDDEEEKSALEETDYETILENTLSDIYSINNKVVKDHYSEALKDAGIIGNNLERMKAQLANLQSNDQNQFSGRPTLKPETNSQLQNDSQPKDKMEGLYQ
jgi:hypothetical protein